MNVYKGLFKRLKKTELRLLEFFVSKIANKYSIQGAGKEIGMFPTLAFRSYKLLAEKRLIIPNRNRLYRLNYKENHHVLVAIEYHRTEDFLSAPNHRDFKRFVKDCIDTIKEHTFTMLLFGSTLEKERPRDYDILFLFDCNKKAEVYQQVLHNMEIRHPSLKLDINIDTLEGFTEMLRKRDERNIVNESLNNHLLLYGAELFYRILSKERPYDV